MRPQLTSIKFLRLSSFTAVRAILFFFPLACDSKGFLRKSSGLRSALVACLCYLFNYVSRRVACSRAMVPVCAAPCERSEPFFLSARYERFRADLDCGAMELGSGILREFAMIGKFWEKMGK